MHEPSGESPSLRSGKCGYTEDVAIRVVEMMGLRDEESLLGCDEHRLTGTTDDGSAIQSTLGEMTGQTTVPNIFIAKEHIGGNSDLQSKKNNLKTLLKDAGAL
jgi:glutaredoxin-related protein